MRVRKVSASGDMLLGHSQADYYVNDPLGVALAAKTRLALWVGQWFLNRPDGTPWATKVLGKYTTDLRDAALRARILGTPGVSEITAYASQFNSTTRAFDVQATATTPYGRVTIQGPQ
jgi:hypothetical protein